MQSLLSACHGTHTHLWTASCLQHFAHQTHAVFALQCKASRHDMTCTTQFNSTPFHDSLQYMFCTTCSINIKSDASCFVVLVFRLASLLREVKA